MGRALAHGRANVREFSDPVALSLLDERERDCVARQLEGRLPRSRRELILAVASRGAEALMGPRTVEIDDGLRAMARRDQVVIVGAGLDARAYRMRELERSVVFEVDHPASQAQKRRRIGARAPCAREVRYVAVDLSRRDLGEALADAGHVSAVPTAWVFEGVITYLEPREVEKAIASMARRSAAGSRLLATYNEPSFMRGLLGSFTARVGEPQRASFSREAMRGLLAERGFFVVSDRDGLERAARWRPRTRPIDRVWTRFHHVVIADFDPSARRPLGDQRSGEGGGV